MMFSQVDHVVPDGSCFEAAGPQGFVKYLAKYVDILGIDAVVFEVDDLEDKLTNDLTIMNLTYLSGGYFISHGGYFYFYHGFFIK